MPRGEGGSGSGNEDALLGIRWVTGRGGGGREGVWWCSGCRKVVSGALALAEVL